MTWAALDVRHVRETTRGLTQDAKVLLLAARLLCAEHETDGAIDATELSMLAKWSEVTTDPVEIAADLVKHGLWRTTPEGWLDVSFGDCNASHAYREQQRQKSRTWRLRQKAVGVVSPLRTGTRTGTRTGKREEKRQEDTDNLLEGEQDTAALDTELIDRQFKSSALE
jgi:hypothetical protein